MSILSNDFTKLLNAGAEFFFTGQLSSLMKSHRSGATESIIAIADANGNINSLTNTILFTKFTKS